MQNLLINSRSLAKMSAPNLDEISKVLAGMIADKMEINVNTISADSKLTDLGLDSLDTFDLIFNANEHFGIKIPNQQVQIKTLQDVAILVQKVIIDQKS
jgi:acyl carrier protein